MSFQLKPAASEEMSITPDMDARLNRRRGTASGGTGHLEPDKAVNGGPSLPTPTPWPLVRLRRGRRNSRTSTPPRPQAPFFWRASRPTCLFAGPLGEVVGAVEEGTVVLERARYRDPFFGNWFATPMAEDGALAWAALDTPTREPGAPTSAWEAVGGVPEAEVGGRGSCGDGVGIPDLIPWVAGSDEGFLSDAALAEYYWGALAVPGEDAARHWNHRYQEAVEAALYEPFEAKSGGKGVPSAEMEKEEWKEWGSPRGRLERLLLEFHTTVENVAVEFVRDTERPPESRCLRRHPTHINIFYYNDLCIKVSTDTSQSSYGGEANARKAAKNIFQSYEYLSLGATSSNCLVSIPLYALAEFGGYRLLVCAIPPLTTADCVYAPLQGGAYAEKVELLDTLTKRLAASLNLSPHTVQIQDPCGNASADPTSVPQRSPGVCTSEVALSVDIELYAGKDRRLYLLNGSRVLPCSAALSFSGTSGPISSSSVGGELNPGSTASGLWYLATERLRAELLLRHPQPINPDWYVEGASTVQDVECLRELSDFVRTDGITTVAGMLGLMLPVDSPALPVRECRLCGKALENEMRLLVCRHEDRCCRICTHCYMARMVDGLDRLNERKEAHASFSRKAKHPSLCTIADLVDFSDAVQCGGVARGADALELEPSIASLMHANGLNLRYLGFVYYRLPRASCPVIGPYLEVEMVARAARKILSGRLRTALTPQSARAVLEEFLIELLSPSGYAAERFWSEKLGPQIRHSFPGVVSPFSSASLSVELLLERFSQLSGVRLSKESFFSLSCFLSPGRGALTEVEVGSLNPRTKPFIEIEAISPRVKVYRMPLQRPPEYQEETASAISSVLERLLVFWIGYAPNGIEERLQPNYLIKLDADYAR